MKTLVFGGSFDPVHRGHLRAARLALEKGGFDRVLFVPAYDPPHKERAALTPYEDRLALLRAALAEQSDPRFGVCEVERLEGTRYTLDTLERIAARCGGEVAFLAGSDSLLDLPKWHRAPELVRRFRILTVPRDRRHDRAFLERSLRGRLPDAEVDRLLEGVLAVEPIEVSASDLRRRLASGEPADDWLPPSVRREIERRSLYRPPPDPPSSGSTDGPPGAAK